MIKDKWKSVKGNILKENVLISCACGCGKKLLKYGCHGYERAYIQGHNNRGKKFPNAKGHKHSEESKKKYGESMKKWWSKNKDSEVIRKRNKKIGLASSQALRGRKIPLDVKKKISKTLKEKEVHRNYSKGETHYNWQGGITAKNEKIRKQYGWKLWREEVFKRDNFLCQNPNCSFCNNQRGKPLHPHHIKRVKDFPELIFDVDNGITYCQDFHLKGGLHRR